KRPRLPGEVDARDDHLLAGKLLAARIELGEPRGRRERVVGEERMGLVDAGVEDADLDARARVRDSSDPRPSGGCVDYADGTVHGGRVGQAGLDQRNPGTRFKRIQARAVE